MLDQKICGPGRDWISRCSFMGAAQQAAERRQLSADCQEQSKHAGTCGLMQIAQRQLGNTGIFKNGNSVYCVKGMHSR